MKNKLAYIISNIDKALAFEWLDDYLDKEKFDITFILLNPSGSVLENYLKEKQTQVYRVHYRGKKDVPSAFLKVRKILKKEKTQIIHCHLFDACFVGLLAAKSLGIKKRIFTRHYATFHHQYFPRAVYYDRFLNYLASDIIAISENVRNVLVEKEKVKAKKVHLIHHGFPLENFENVSDDNIKILQEKYNTASHFPIIGVIARWTHWKGIQFIIPAFQKLLKDYPNVCLVLANASGEFRSEIEKLLTELPKNSFREIVFEQDLFTLYRLFDVYVHVPINLEIEAFGQTYIEALASGVPSVFTLSGVANEFIENENNALAVPFEDSEAIYQAIQRILSDEKLKENLIINGKKSVQEKFAVQKMIDALENLYLQS